MQFIRSVKSHITHDSFCCVNQSVKSRENRKGLGLRANSLAAALQRELAHRLEMT